MVLSYRDTKLVSLNQILSRSYNQNIYKLFPFLAQFLLIASETELDYYHQKVRV